MSNLFVWHIPQVPGKSFKVPVADVREGVMVMDLLSAYDDFQYVNRIKGDYASVQGLEMDAEDGETESWYTEDGDGYDDPREYLADLDAGRIEAA